MMPAHVPVLDDGRRDSGPGLVGDARAARADILPVHALTVALVEQRVEAGARIEHRVGHGQRADTGDAADRNRTGRSCRQGRTGPPAIVRAEGNGRAVGVTVNDARGRRNSVGAIPLTVMCHRRRGETSRGDDRQCQ